MKGFESRFKIDCPSDPDREFHFWVTLDLDEWENNTYAYYDVDEATGEHANCTAMKQLKNDPYEYAEAYGESGLTALQFTLSHSSGQTQGGFVGNKQGLGMTGVYTYSTCWSCYI